MKYLPRTVDTELDTLLAEVPAIAIEGPKGVGKTRTATRRAATVRYLDEPSQQVVLAADPGALRRDPRPVLIDEWQRWPAVWDVVRRWVDDGAPPAAVLLTGSATPSSGLGTHSGAGRILSLRMRPMALFERGTTEPTVRLSQLLDGSAPITGQTSLTLADYLREITASGFPGIRRFSPLIRAGELDAYLARVIDRDLPEQGLGVRRPETLRRWLAAYAAASSTTAAYSRILDAVTGGDGHQPAKSTTLAYRDFLTQLWLLDPVPGWSPSRNPFTRLQQAPKHQLADPALAARLLNLTEQSLARGSGTAMTGPLFEALTTLSVRVAAQASMARVGHLRTANGDREIDLVVEGLDGQVVGIEVKLARSVTDADVRHLLWLRDRLGHDVADLLVITAGEYAYRRPDGVAVVPLALFGA